MKRVTMKDEHGEEPPPLRILRVFRMDVNNSSGFSQAGIALSNAPKKKFVSRFHSLELAFNPISSKCDRFTRWPAQTPAYGTISFVDRRTDFHQANFPKKFFPRIRMNETKAARISRPVVHIYRNHPWTTHHTIYDRQPLLAKLLSK